MSGDTPKNDAVESGAEVDLPEKDTESDDGSASRVSARDIFNPERSDKSPADAQEAAEPLQEDADPLLEDAEPLQEDADPLLEDDKPLQEDDKPLQEDDKPLQEDAETLQDADDDDDDDDDDNVLSLENSEDNTPDEILLSRIESLIFIYPEPITVRRLAKHLSLTGKRVRELVEKLKSHYADRGIHLSEISGGFQFHTNPQNADVIRTLTKVKPLRMSRPALETLAIVAYKQPCTRAEVEDVRRVDCGGTLKFLFEKELIRVLGRKEEPGRPIIYGTSSKFLELFNLKSLTDLPSLHEYTELWDEHKELVDDAPDADGNAAEASAPKSTMNDRQQEIPVDDHLTNHTDAESDTESDTESEDIETDDSDNTIDDSDDASDDYDDTIDDSNDATDDSETDSDKLTVEYDDTVSDENDDDDVLDDDDLDNDDLDDDELNDEFNDDDENDDDDEEKE